jgi:hypothetical protein
MKKLSLLSKICFVLGFIGVIGSIIISIISKKDFTWQFITLMWMGSALVSDLRIKELEEKL